MNFSFPNTHSNLIDHFSNPHWLEGNSESRGVSRQKKSLRKVVRSLEDNLLAQKRTASGTIQGCKMLSQLRIGGITEPAGKKATLFNLKNELMASLNALSNEGGVLRTMSSALVEMADELNWYSASTGPSASLDFETSHAHAVLGVQEKRVCSDLVVFGITILCPNTRFPDYAQRMPRVMYPLSEGDYLSMSGKWVEGQIGSPVFCPAQRPFAMRCASRPLLSLWCQKYK